MSFFDKVRDFFIKKQQKAEPAIGFQRYVGEASKIYDTIQRTTSRRSKVAKSQIMAHQDARISRILYKLASDVFAGGLKVQLVSFPSKKIKKQAEKVLASIMKIILEKGKSWTESLIRDGDIFLEIIPSSEGIEDVRKLATQITFTRMNEKGDLPLEKAYYQECPYTKKILAEFDSWQVVHLSWHKEDGEPYGNGMFFPSQGHYDGLVSAEKNLLIRRVVRAGKRLLHKVGTAEKPARWEQVEEYRRVNANTLANPLDPVQDFWSNGLVDIKEIDSDRDIGVVTDIEHFEALLPLQAGIPKALLGREQNVNRDVLEEQEEDYFRVIGDISLTMEWGFRKIIDLALLLAGILPDAVTYEFVWGNRDRSDAKDKLDMALKLQQLGFSFQSIFEFLAINKLDFAEEIERIKKQVQDGTIPYGVNMKLDPVINALKQGEN